MLRKTSIILREIQEKTELQLHLHCCILWLNRKTFISRIRFKIWKNKDWGTSTVLCKFAVKTDNTPPPPPPPLAIQLISQPNEEACITQCPWLLRLLHCHGWFIVLKSCGKTNRIKLVDFETDHKLVYGSTNDDCDIFTTQFRFLSNFRHICFMLYLQIIFSCLISVCLWFVCRSTLLSSLQTEECSGKVTSLRLFVVFCPLTSQTTQIQLWGRYTKSKRRRRNEMKVVFFLLTEIIDDTCKHTEGRHT